jgi:hypothetical protein
MGENPQENPVLGDKTPLDVEFSTPACRYESISFYQNPETGQVFKLTASSPEEEALNNFLEPGFLVWLEVRPGDDSQAPEPEGDSYEEMEFEEQPLVTFEIEVLEAAGIEPPYIVAFYIDPPISAANKTSPQSYTFRSTKWVQVNLHADSGNMLAKLRRGGSTKQANFNRAANVNVALTNSSGSPTTFRLNITGDGRFDLAGQYLTS